MIDEQLRHTIWQEMLDVARLIRYYESLGERYRKYHLYLRFLLFASAVGGITALINQFPIWIQLAVDAMIALCVVLDFVQNNAKNAAVLHNIRTRCSELEVEWTNLWENFQHLERNEIQRKNNRLREKLREATDGAGPVKIDAKLNAQCAKDAYEAMEARYA